MSITSANSVFMIAVPDLFPVPVKLQGYSADDAFMADAVVVAETLMGVIAANCRQVMCQTQHPSPSHCRPTARPSLCLRRFVQAMQAAKGDTYAVRATIAVPGISRAFACTKGFLTEYKPFPDAKKLLQPVAYKITFESVTASAI